MWNTWNRINATLHLYADLAHKERARGARNTEIHIYSVSPASCYSCAIARTHTRISISVYAHLFNPAALYISAKNMSSTNVNIFDSPSVSRRVKKNWKDQTRHFRTESKKNILWCTCVRLSNNRMLCIVCNLYALQWDRYSETHKPLIYLDSCRPETRLRLPIAVADSQLIKITRAKPIDIIIISRNSFARVHTSA